MFRNFAHKNLNTIIMKCFYFYFKIVLTAKDLTQCYIIHYHCRIRWMVVVDSSALLQRSSPSWSRNVWPHHNVRCRW